MKVRTVKVGTVIVLMLFPCCPAFSATWDSDGTVQSIQSIHDKQAHDGDTITVPAGTYHWDAVLNITKGITLRGQTTVTGNAMDANGFTVTDKSIILEESPPNAGSAVNVTLTPSQHFEITGLTIRGSTPTRGSSAGLNAWMALKTPTDEANYNTRIHHNHFDMIYRLCIVVVGAYYGVADHNQATIRGISGGERFIHFSQSNAHGNAVFADYSWFGTNKFFFLEDCYIKLVSPRGFSDCTHGGMRLVVRHNHIINGSSGDHGTEGGNSRGQRAVESYDNLLEFPLRTGTASHGTRGGNKLAHDNTISGAGKIDTLGSLNFFRTFGGGSGGDWLVADGSSPWDKNATEPDGTYVDANPPRPAHVFANGTCTQDDPATTGYVGTLIDGAAHWKPNQWVGYSIHNIDRARGGYITANTATEIKFYRYTSTDRGPVNAFTVGQKYQVHKVLKAIDVAGSGKGDLVVGKVNSKTGVASWLHVIQEPTISWNNKVLNNNTYVGFNCGAPFVHEGPNDGTPGFDFYNLGGGFPADSTPSQVAGLLTAAVNGVQYSGTFTYPHPLTTGASPTSGATPTKKE